MYSFVRSHFVSNPWLNPPCPPYPCPFPTMGVCKCLICREVGRKRCECKARAEYRWKRVAKEEVARLVVWSAMNPRLVCAVPRGLVHAPRSVAMAFPMRLNVPCFPYLSEFAVLGSRARVSCCVPASR